MTIHERYCDICGAKLDVSGKSVWVHVITNCEWEEGRATEPYVESMKYDLCDSCLMKSTNLRCDCRGSNLRFKED